jgi:DNA-binding GntR family transcriptional regulator
MDDVRDEPRLVEGVKWSEALSGGRQTAHEFVRESLRRAILRGDIDGGARLIQADLASTLNVSTTPVREALRDLATEGLITLDRHRGGIVRELNWDDMEEIRLVRLQLEPLAVRLAVERISAEQLERADVLWRSLADADDLGNWVELNTQFHFLFHDAIGARRLTSIMKGLEEASTLYVAQAQRWHPEIRREANQQHQILIESCRRGDADRAVEVMKEHASLPIEMTDPEERRRR